MALDFIAGCTGGIAGVMVGYPLDTVKVHLQTQDLKFPKYKGTWHCFTTIVKNESVTGLYKGMTSPMAGVAIVNAVLFGVYGNVSRMLPTQWSPTLNVFVAGASAGMIQSFICSPMELAKIRLQLQEQKMCGSNSSRPHYPFQDGQRKQFHLITVPQASQTYKNPLDCLLKIHQTEGLHGVFRGFGITICREVPAFGFYFASYEHFCRLFSGGKPDCEVGPMSILMAGGFSGIASWIVTYPMDVIKTRVQMDGVWGPKQYRGALDCAKKSYQNEGLNCFTRGLSSTVIRAFPTNAATFFVVTLTFKLLRPNNELLDLPTQQTEVLDVKDTTTFDSEFRHLKTAQQRRLLVQEGVGKSEDKMSDIARLAPYAEATFW